MNWSVTADTRAAAIEQLRAEDIRRAQSQPGYIVARQEALSRHLTDPIPGVFAIPMRVAERFMGTPGEQAELDRIADDMDAGRIPNPPTSAGDIRPA